MAQPSSLSSNNPFRRNGLSTSVPTPAAAPPPFSDALDLPSSTALPLPSGDQFRAQMQDLPQSALPPPATSFQKPKVVKKVRVQSPPPSSPESAGAPDGFSRNGPDWMDGSSSDDDYDDTSNPFNITVPGAFSDNRGSGLGGEDAARPVANRVPLNPFQRTLQDLESGSQKGEQSVVSPGQRGTLDVDAFKRLLLTGQAAGPGTAQAPSPATASSAPLPIRPGAQTTDGASLTDASSISRQSLPDAAHLTVHDTPHTSHEISEPEGDDDEHGLVAHSRPEAQPPAMLRKKPPPPSSRHGKLIKVELKSRGQQEDERPPSVSPREAKAQRPSLPSLTSLPDPATPPEVNKPLPPAPHKDPVGDDELSIFDQQAAGKVPEPAGDVVEEPLPVPRPPTPPNISHSTPNPTVSSPQSSKKPPPPPRRHTHGRSESKASTAQAAHHSHADELDAHPQRRSSQDSTRSRSSSLRVSIHAPAPPPPRRPTHNPRPSNSFISPSTVSFSSVAYTGSEKSPSGSGISPLPTGISPTHGSDAVSPPPREETSRSATEPSTATPSPLHHPGNQTKLSPPPPPPARHASTRSKKPASVSSLDAISRRVAGPLQPPPPPPPRQRGSSKGSIDGVAVSTRKVSTDGARIHEGKLAEEPAVTPVSAEPVEQTSTAPDILADLTALQREVDALRGKVEKGGL